MTASFDLRGHLQALAAEGASAEEIAEAGLAVAMAQRAVSSGSLGGRGLEPELAAAAVDALRTVGYLVPRAAGRPS